MININTKYTFEDFTIDLSNGREFDLIIYGEKYGVSRFGGGKVCFAKYDDQSFCKYFDTYYEFIQKAKVNNKLLSSIWNDNVELDIMY